MDDHMLDRVLSYASWGLIPRLQAEYNACGSLTACPSYGEAVDLCKVLTLISKYVDGRTYKPSDLLDYCGD